MVGVNRRTMLRVMALTFFCAGLATPAARCANKHGKAITADGRPIRKVYIRAGGPDMGNAAATQMAQDTCLTRVSSPEQADAVLDVGIALPSEGGGGGGAPGTDFFGAAPHAQTMGQGDSAQPHRSASATCSDSKGSSGCTGSYTGAAGGQASSDWGANSGATFDVSLASPGKASQDLWDPKEPSKKSWSQQLRAAAGCPVCPHGHFDRRKYHTYRNWIQTECPDVMAAQ